MAPMRSIVYVSTAITPMSEADLSALLIEARHLNAESHVTGVLLYGGGNFMQCFEGPGEAMEGTYGRIRASKRHTGIIELVNESVPSRSFVGWEMGFKGAQKSELLALSTAQWQRQATAPDHQTGPFAGMVLLRNFWNQDLRA